MCARRHLRMLNVHILIRNKPITVSHSNISDGERFRIGIHGSFIPHGCALLMLMDYEAHTRPVILQVHFPCGGQYRLDRLRGERELFHWEILAEIRECWSKGAFGCGKGAMRW